MTKLLCLTEATVNDIDTLVRLDKLSNLTPWNKAKYLDSFNNSLHQIFVLQDDKQNIIGCIVVAIILDEMEILQLWVANKYKTKGFGEYLLTKAIEEIKHKTTIKQVLLEVLESNEVAIKLYTKVGFNLIYTRKNYYNINGYLYNAMVMKLTI